MSDTTTDPPAPPPFDPDAPRCRAHRHIPPGQPVDCQACREARVWVDKRRAEQTEAQAAQVRECPMCDRGGQRWDPVTHVALSPLWSCDHSTPHEIVMADIRERDDRAERSRSVPRPRPPVPSTEAGRARAIALFRRSRSRVAVPAQRPVPESDPTARETARRELAHAAARAAGKYGPGEVAAPGFDHGVAV